MDNWIGGLISSLLMATVSAATAAQEVDMSDPTAPPGKVVHTVTKSQPKTAALPTLKAIFQGTQAPGAVLDHQFVALGESVNGYRLTQLAADYVVVSKNRQQFRVTLEPGSVNQMHVKEVK